jgi:hypothetical protein
MYHFSQLYILSILAINKFSGEVLFHSVDDYYGISEIDIAGQGPKDMRRLRSAFEMLNVPTNEEHGFCDGIVITGTEVCYSDATFQLSQGKLGRYLSTCRSFLRKSMIRVDELKRVCGIRDHCLYIVPYIDFMLPKRGRTPNRRLQPWSSIKTSMNHWCGGQESCRQHQLDSSLRIYGGMLPTPIRLVTLALPAD